MVRTHGLTHINLAVRDGERSVEFYRQVFGCEEYARGGGLIHVKTPGSHDVITFAPGADQPGVAAGVAHFGFRLTDPADISLAVAEAERAGGKILRQAEFAPGYPYVYIEDPDGYEIEIWYE